MALDKTLTSASQTRVAPIQNRLYIESALHGSGRSRLGKHSAVRHVAN